MPITARVSADFTRAMDRLRSELHSPSSATRAAVLAKVAAVDALQNAQTFATERSPEDGAAFAPLSPKYARVKKRRFPGRKILTATGKMRDSTRFAKSADRIARWAADRAAVELGTRNEFALFHQFGTSRMPARPFIGKNVEQAASLRDAMASTLARRFAIITGSRWMKLTSTAAAGRLRVK